MIDIIMWLCLNFLENSVDTIFSKNQKFLSIIFLLTHVQNDFWPIKGQSIYQLYLVKNYSIAVLVLYPPIDLHLIFEKTSLKNQVGQTWFFVYLELDFCRLLRQKNQVPHRQKIKFVQLAFSNSFFSKIKCRSIGG